MRAIVERDLFLSRCFREGPRGAPGVVEGEGGGGVREGGGYVGLFRLFYLFEINSKINFNF